MGRAGQLRSGFGTCVLGLVAAVAVGCGGTISARGRVVYPAEVPVRAFPRIWVTGGHLQREIRIVQTLVDHLRSASRAQVRRVQVDDLEPMRRAGDIPPATVVVMVEVAFEEQTRPEWVTRPETVCGPLGCYTRNRAYMYDVPIVEGTLTLTVYEGPTARVLQRVSSDARAEGRGYEHLRKRVVAKLVHRARELVDRREERVEVELLRVEVESVERALELIENDQWHEGRKLLEKAARSEAVRNLPAEERARVYYDLALARRFDSVTRDDIERHFRAAKRPLRKALRLDPESRYAEALEQLEEHRRRLQTLREQEKAAEHNYSVGRLHGRIPEPPAGYGKRNDSENGDG